MNGNARQSGPDPAVLLRVAEHFLRRRHFDDCRKYANQANQTGPNFPGISQILAIADVLHAAEQRVSAGTLPDWYAVLQLNRYSQDSDLIRQRFNHLYSLLNPSNNKFLFADEAFDVVCDAWYVLTNPLKKLEFDNALKKYLDDDKSKEQCDFAFWTVCPYCYHLYEYPRVYLELCLRCPNEKCSKAFTCLEINRPPVEVLTEGKYICAGFLPVGSQDAGSWNPFVPLTKEKGNDSDDTGNFVEISDDADEVDTKCDKSVNVNGDESVKMETVKLESRRKKKSLAKNTKKVTGTGNRVTKEGFAHPNGVKTGLNIDEKGFDSGFLGESMDAMNGGEVEFYDADDDILVSLQNGM